MKFFISMSICALLLAPSLYGTPQETQVFFDRAQRGDYKALFQLTQKTRFNRQEIMNAKNAHGDTLLMAALQGYGAAFKNYGAKSEQMLFDTLTLLLSRLSKADALTLVNTANNTSYTPLFAAAQLGILKVTWLLHDKGALSVIGSKKASARTNNPQLKNILLEWENLEGDWVDLGTAKG